MITFEFVSSLLWADFDTGKLFWKARPVALFKDHRASKIWNTRYAGQEAFTADNGHGYRCGQINGRRYQAHRVIWLLHSGEWPCDQIDHINGDRQDNRLVNLREASSSENHKNQRVSSNSTSGVCGVRWHTRDKKWNAHITIDGKANSLGYFALMEDAIAARKAAEARLGFHPNHGRA